MDGQLSLSDFIVKPCECGTIPELTETKCCHWDEKKPQKWLSIYVCPNCLNEPVDNTGWPIEAWNTREEAAREAIQIWNNNPKKPTKIVPFEFTEVGRRLGRQED